MRGRGPTHLRAYGADSRRLPGPATSCDSPPCVRSGLLRWLRGEVGARLTSVRTERTPTARPRGASPSTHLRAYGADPSPGISGSGGVDSPPCVRSGQPGRVCGPRVRRLTSVRTERTAAPATSAPPPSTHLRAYGADSVRPLTTRVRADSPPCVRSGPVTPRTQQRGGRLTSVRTERTPPNTAPHPTCSTHLRAYGADSAFQLADPTSVDSPPCVRSGLHHLVVDRLLRRLTSVRTERTPSRPAALERLCKFLTDAQAHFHYLLRCRSQHLRCSWKRPLEPVPSRRPFG